MNTCGLHTTPLAAAIAIVLCLGLAPRGALAAPEDNVGVATSQTAPATPERNTAQGAVTPPAKGTSEANNDASKTVTLDTVVVTAQKRSQNILDVPASIGVITSDELKSLNVFNVSDLKGYFANAQFHNGSEVVIRGVGGSSAQIGIANRVGVYIDGVYVGQSANINQNLLGISRIEVLRGPQGTMFGANTIAGAVNIITQRPSQTFTGSATLGVGNLGLLREQAADSTTKCDA